VVPKIQSANTKIQTP